MPPSNRERILEGAIECVQTLGIADTTSRDIAGAAGASLASIPYHFGSKDALVDLALLRAMERYTDHLRDLALASPGDPSDTLARAFDALLSSFGESKALMTSLMESYVRALHSDAHRQHIAEHRRSVVEQLQLLIEQTAPDRPPDADTRAMAVLLLSLIDGLIMHWLMDPEDLPPAATLVGSLTEVNSLLTAHQPATGKHDQAKLPGAATHKSRGPKGSRRLGRSARAQ